MASFLGGPSKKTPSDEIEKGIFKGRDIFGWGVDGVGGGKTTKSMFTAGGPKDRVKVKRGRKETVLRQEKDRREIKKSNIGKKRHKKELLRKKVKGEIIWGGEINEGPQREF